MNKEPLTESYFYILLCLFKEPNHGYGIMQETARLSKDRVKIGSGTMYGAVSNMIKKGWIEEFEDDSPAAGRSGPAARKRMYRLTQDGTESLMAEVSRLRELLEHAQELIGRTVHPG